MHLVRRFLFALMTLHVAFAIASAVAAEPSALRVSAAISLKDVLETLAKAYEKETGQRVDFVFGASGALAAQIERGAEVDVFISAARPQVDQLIKANAADAASVRVIATNALVLVAPADSKVVSSFEDLKRDTVKRIAAGEPRAVPAGTYAKQTLDKLGLSDPVKDKFVFGSNVRQVLDYVIRGEVDAGLVYRTDAQQAGDKVRVIATADQAMHDPIEYPAVVISASKRRDAAAKFLDFLQGEAARAELKRLGFTVPEKTSLVPGLAPSPLGERAGVRGDQSSVCLQSFAMTRPVSFPLTLTLSPEGEGTGTGVHSLRTAPSALFRSFTREGASAQAPRLDGRAA